MAISPEIRLKRYLCFTSEGNVYRPGRCEKRYTLESVPSLADLIADGKEEYIFNLIKIMHDEGKIIFMDAVLFVLAEMCREPRLRPIALQLADKICLKAETFFVFLKFCLEGTPKIGFGRAFRKFVRNWYLKKDHIRLAEVIGQFQKFRGWRHADILKLVHIKSTEPAKAASFKYAINGVEAMKKEFGDVEEAKTVVSYLSTVDEYRKKQDSAEVALKVDSYLLGIEHVNFTCLEDKKVWIALLRMMPVLQVLNHFQFMSRRKMFRNTRNWDFIFIDTVTEALTKPCADKTGVSANKAFIELINYENAGRVKLELASKLRQVVKKAPILNTDLSNAVMKVMDDVIKLRKPLGKRIMIAVEISTEMLKRRCCVSRYMTLIEAAAFISYYFLRTETVVKVFTCNASGIKPLNFIKDGTVKLLIETLKSENVVENEQKNKRDEHIVNWIKEAGRGDEEIDACIILKSYLDINSLHTLCSTGNTNNKKIKYVVCDLSGVPKNSKPPDKWNLFVTSGFDDRTTDAISLFVENFV